MDGLDGKVVILTGGSMGIGAALAGAFRKAEAWLVVAARHASGEGDVKTDVTVAAELPDAQRTGSPPTGQARGVGGRSPGG